MLHIIYKSQPRCEDEFKPNKNRKKKLCENVHIAERYSYYPLTDFQAGEVVRICVVGVEVGPGELVGGGRHYDDTDDGEDCDGLHP